MPLLYKPKTKTGDLIKFPQIFHEILIFNGAWPTHNDGSDFKSKLYMLFGWFVLLNMSLINFCEIGGFFANMTDVILASQAFCTAMTGFFVVLRSLYFRIFSKQLKKLLITFSEEIWIDGYKHPHLVQKYRQVMLPVFIYFVFLFSTLILYVSFPVIVFFRTNQTLDSQDKGLPYLMEFPYDVQNGKNYVITYILSIHAGWIIVSHFYAYDAIVLLFVSYLCGQLEILHSDIVRLIPECHDEWQNSFSQTMNVSKNRKLQWETGRNKLLQDMYTERLHKISARHNQLISFCVQLNDLVSPPLFLNVIVSTFLVCFCGFQFLISTETANYLYLCNWEGGQLSDGSLLVLQSKDTSSLNVKLPLWKSIQHYPASKDFRNKLRFMIMRSQHPLELNAMNYTIISLETFAKILSSSMSYFTLLKSFLDDEI